MLHQRLECTSYLCYLQTSNFFNTGLLIWFSEPRFPHLLSGVSYTYFFRVLVNRDFIYTYSQ